MCSASNLAVYLRLPFYRSEHFEFRCLGCNWDGLIDPRVCRHQHGNLFSQSEDKLLDEQPVITPDAEVTSQQILIDDIDVPVEIKADQPIQVEIDDSGTFQDIREI